MRHEGGSFAGSQGALLAHQAHRKRRIARYQMLCRVAWRSDRALVFATLLSLKISNFVGERNWLTGGSYTIYSTGGVSVRDNIFGRENGGLSAGKEDRRIRSGTFDEWSGNRWEDTGDPI